MKFVSWNVNGLRACIQKDFLQQFQQMDADFFCLQETKLSAGQLELDLPGYEQYWCYAEKKGYSGTAIFTKHHPVSVSYGIGVPDLDTEGRVITLEYQEFYLVTCYTPNAQRGLARLDHRMTWDEAFREYLHTLDQNKPVVICGDLNVAHKEIDLKNPASNRKNAGFSDEERESFQKTLDCGFTDTFRHLYPDVTGRYSWWSYMFHARENNAGWRIDYFLVSDRVAGQIQQADIHSNILGSDHCPVSLELDTLVNGSIWSPDAGVPTVIEAEPTKNTSKKASPVNGKALALLCLILLVFCSLGVIPHLIGTTPNQTDPTEEKNELFTIHVLTNRFTPYLSGNNTNHSTTANCFKLDDTVYYTHDVSINGLSSTNLWFRVDLTQKGKEIFRDDLELIVHSINNLISSTVGTNFSDFKVAPYYADKEHTVPLGWFVWGNLTQDDTLVVLLPEYSFYLTLPIRVTPYFSVEQIPMQPTLVYRADTGYSLRAGDNSFSVGEEIWAIETDLLEADFWVYIKLSEDGLKLLDAENYSLNYHVTPTQGQASYVNSFPFYSYVQPGTIKGFIMYGKNVLNLHSISITSSANTLPYPDIVNITPYIRSDEAQTMSTQLLINHILSNKGIVDDMMSNTTVGKLADRYPAFLVLLQRSDALQVLVGKGALDNTGLKLFAILREYCSQDQTETDIATFTHYDCPIHLDKKLTDAGWQCTITDHETTYYTDNANFEPDKVNFVFRMDINEGYIKLFSMHILKFSANTGLMNVTTIPYYTDETRTTVAGWFFFGSNAVQQISSIKIDGFLVYSGTIVTQHFDNPDPFGYMSASELVDYILSNETIVNDIINPEPGQNNWVGHLCCRYPALKDLFTRVAAGECLRNWMSLSSAPNPAATALYDYWLLTIGSDIIIPEG